MEQFGVLFSLGMCMELLPEWNSFKPGMIFGEPILGVRMCFCMVWENIILGTIIGLVGIMLLLLIIPATKGLK